MKILVGILLLLGIALTQLGSVTQYHAVVARKKISGGAYTPSLVENTTSSASFTKTGSFAADSNYFWIAGIFDFNTDAGTSTTFRVAGRSEIQRVNDGVTFKVISTSATTIFDGAYVLSAGTEKHLFFVFDGSAGTAKLYVDGVDTVFDTITTAATTGTVDHSRSSFTVCTDTVYNSIGDFLLGSTTPPASIDVYNGGYIDVSGVTADYSLIGNAAFWNGNPEGLTSLGTWTDK